MSVTEQFPRRVRLLWLFVILLAALPAGAQERAAEPQFTTAAALERAVIPPHDPVAVAQRLFDIGPIEPPPAAAPALEVGARDTFWVDDSAGDRQFQVEATLRAVGVHIYLWAEAGADVDDAALAALAAGFDTNVYGPVRDLWGSENSPGIDGDPRVHALFVHGLGAGIGAYYAGRHTQPRAVAPTSNAREMFFFNLDSIDTRLPTPILESVMAHEFQHMIRDNIAENQDTWLDEGLSEFTELVLNYDRRGSAVSFLFNPNTQLNTWSEAFPRGPDYGGALLFFAYLNDRYGLETVRAVSRDSAPGLQAVDHALRARGAPGVEEFFADWVLANFLLDPTAADGRFGYQSLTPGLPSPPPIDVVTQYPYRHMGEVRQYAADYFVLTNVRDLKALTVRIDAPQQVRLVPVDAFSGDRMWYSNRGDASDMRLTRAFDLRAVDSATLTYRTWYHFENLWDYGYVMVSVDGGDRWEILPAPHTTTENPHGNAYGPGYTGRSDGWVQETVALDDYAGREILLRFEAITDDAVNQPGMVVDDVAIPEVGYFGDFEADDGGWLAEGWVWIDNVLPQTVWVQAVQQMGFDIAVTRWQAPAQTAWELPLEDNVDQVVIAVSPFAPLTTVPLDYTFSVAAQ